MSAVHDPAELLTVAVKVLRTMASRRGHVLSYGECAQAWQQAIETEVGARLAAAYQRLMPQEYVTPTLLPLVTADALPGWWIDDQGLPELVDTLSDRYPPTATIWLVSARVPEVIEPVKRPATQAIVTALRVYQPLFLRGALATVWVNLLAIMTSLYAMQIYDRVVPNFAYATLWVLTIGLFLALGLELFLRFLRLHLIESMTERVDRGLSQFFFDRVMALKLDRRPQKLGTLVAQVKDYESVKAFFTSTTLFVLADFPFVFFFIAVVAVIGGPIAWVLVVFLPLAILVGWLAQRPLSVLQAEQTDESTRRHGVLVEVVQGAETIKSQGGEWRFSVLWGHLTEKLADQGARIRTLSGQAQFITQALQQVCYASLLVVGVYLIEAGHLTMGGLIACSILGARALSNISQITPVMVQWHQTRHALTVLNQLMSVPADDDERRMASTDATPCRYELTQLVYAYEPDQSPQLTIPSLTIPVGSRIAVLGHNGGGKTTFMKVLAGLATPTQGTVRLAGLDLQHTRLGWQRQVIGYLPQDVRLFAGTLRDNLTLGLPLPRDEALMEAAAQTGLDRWLLQHPLGLDLPVREGGTGLSGGQRQLIAFTRLVLQQPNIWLLDEPSASLDFEVEARVMDVLRRLSPEQTLIFTTHKKSWLNLADRALVLADGQIRLDQPAAQILATQPNASPSEASS